MPTCPVLSQPLPSAQLRAFHRVPLQASAVAVCTMLFLTVAVGSQLAFGPDVPADVLTQFNAGGTLERRFRRGCIARHPATRRWIREVQRHLINYSLASIARHHPGAAPFRTLLSTGVAHVGSCKHLADPLPCTLPLCLQPSWSRLLAGPWRGCSTLLCESASCSPSSPFTRCRCPCASGWVRRWVGSGHAEG